MPPAPHLCLLHIGKTGGTFLRSILRQNRARWSRPIQVLRHNATLMNTLDSFGADRELAFTFRDPAERFVSAFYSRLRQGRPTYQSDWSTAEATAFLWFKSAEELALALTSDDARDRSAALFAFGSIAHINNPMSAILNDAQTVRRSRNQIVMCVETADLDSKLPQVMERLGLPEWETPEPPIRHASPTPLPKLSAAAHAALKTHWAEDFAIYQACRELAANQGLSG
jgi:hypothetical protein